MCDLCTSHSKTNRYPISAKLILVDIEYALLDWYRFIRTYMYSEIVYTIIIRL